MDTFALYALAEVGLALSLAKDRGKTKRALSKAWKAVEGILPRFLGVPFPVAAFFVGWVVGS